MPPLPKCRVTESLPFVTTGLNYLGPLYVKDGTVTQKVWVCLFTCLSTRAIHLELVADMSADQFLLCLQRFIARRGKPSRIICDNASQFKLVHSTVDKMWKRVTMAKDVITYVSDKNIQWSFITERAPWRGGFYERLVRLVKQALRKTLGKICLTVIQLQTVLCEFEAVLNSKPLAYVRSNFESRYAITPAPFLSLNVNTGTPPLNQEEGA